MLLIPKNYTKNSILKGICIMLHGYGASKNDMLECLYPVFSEYLHDFAFFAPNALEKYEEDYGWKWFDIIRSENLSKEIEYLQKGLKQCTNQCIQLIETEISTIKQNYNIDHTFEVILTGFSQGAILALHLACHGYIKNIKKVLSLSGAFIDIGLRQNLQKDIDILFLHGEEDEVIKKESAILSVRTLNQLGFSKVKHNIFPKLAHSISYEMLKEASLFLTQN